MALIDISNQYRYSGRGPFDAKTLVKTYADLLATETWTTISASGTSVVSAYNGLITAVWLNKDDTSKNGIYFLYDPEVTSPLKTPNVTLASNWHKLCEIDALTELTEQLKTINAKLAELSNDIERLDNKAEILAVVDRATFPPVGKPNVMYVDVSKNKTYIWFENNYIPASSDAESVTYSMICGGNAEE
jgi:hypothetical protein